MKDIQENIENFVESLFQEFATTEEVLKHLNKEIDKVIEDEFYFDEPSMTFDFLNKARRFVQNKSRFQ